MLRKYTKSAYYLVFAIILLSSCSKQPIEKKDNWAKSVPNNQLTNLYMVSDSVYRSEQPNKSAFKEIERLGIKSVLNLRTTKTDDENAESTNLNLYLVEMKAEKLDEDKILEALKIIKDAPKPILIHCKHGSDRTGLMVALYRIVIQGWDKESAIDELENGGFGFHSIFFNIPSYIRNADIEKIREAIK